MVVIDINQDGESNVTVIATRPSVYEGTVNMFRDVFLPFAEQYILRQPGRRFTGDCNDFIDQVHRANGITERDLVLQKEGDDDVESLLVPLRLYLATALRAQGEKFHLHLDEARRNADGSLFVDIGYLY